MTRVLVATDGSQLAIAAGRRAVALLGTSAEVTVVSVAPVVTPTSGLPELDARTLEVEDQARLDAARQNVLTTIAGLGIEAHERVEVGEAGQVICEIADREGFDVIVVGSHGAGALKRIFLGSVSHDVLRNAPCPVIIVRPLAAEQE